jgi:hypothetical protein
MLTFPMPNTLEFGRRIYAIRTVELDVAQDRIADAGGPSAPQQSRIENGSDQPVSREFLLRYAAAAHALRPNKFSGQADSVFEALAAMYNAAADHGDAERSSVISKAARNCGADEIVLGFDLATDEIITARGITIATKRPVEQGNYTDQTDTYLAEAAGQDQSDFVDAAFRIAGRYRGITIVVNDGRIDPAMVSQVWAKVSAGAVQELADRRLDPIGDVTTLAAARKRAIAVGALSPDETQATAWIILLSNAIGRATEKRPIDAYADYADKQQYWDSVLADLDPRVRSELPYVTTLLKRAKPHLEPLIPDRDWSTADWEIELTGVGKSTGWKVDVPVDHQPITPAAGDVWMTGSISASRLAAKILESMNVPNITFEPRGVLWPRLNVNTTAPVGIGETYGWAPSWVGERPHYAFLRNEQTGVWRAAQMY